MYLGEIDPEYTPTLDGVVVALCADYPRRQSFIEKGGLSKRCEMEYKYLNYKILEAACEVTDDRLARILIKDIGDKVGYAYTEAYYLSESTYKRQKREVKINIAKKLHLGV